MDVATSQFGADPNYAKTYLINKIYKTIDPVIQTALIELLGSSTAFKRIPGTLTFKFNSRHGIIGGAVAMKYQSNFLKVPAATAKAIDHDREFLSLYLEQLPCLSKLEENSIQIDTEKGIVQISFDLSVENTNEQ